MDYVCDASAGPEAAIARRAMLGRNLRDFEAARDQGASVADVTALALAEVRAQLPAFLAVLRAGLAPEVASPATRSGTSSSSSSSFSLSLSRSPGAASAAAPQVLAHVPGAAAPARYVSSAWTSTRHAIAVGPDTIDVSAAWQTACG